MPRFEIQMNGRNFEIEAPDFNSAAMALQGFGAKPSEQAIGQGDWAGLQDRLNATEQRVKDSGPYRPQDVDATLKGEAKRQGLLYGQEQGQKEGSGGIFGGSAANTLGLGLPRYLEAVTNPAVKTAYAHEFLKAADEGRAKAAPIASGAGTVAGYVGQAAMLPASGAATLGGRALSAAGQSGTLAALEAGIESRGDLGQIAQSGVVGGLMGGAASAGVEKTIQAGRRFIDPMRGFAKSGPAEQQATARILLAAKNAGIDDATAQRKLAELGPDGFIADVLGKRGQSLARSSANLSPDARTLLEEASTQRMGGQTDRLLAALQGAAGTPVGKTVDEVVENISKASRPAINQAYNAAKAAGYDMPRTPFDQILSSPKVMSAIKQAEKEIADRVAVYGPEEASQLAVYDAAKKILDRMGWKEGDDVAKALAAKLRQTVDQNLPEYKGARALAEGIKKQQEAVMFGAEGAQRTIPNDFIKRVTASQYPTSVSQGYALAQMERIANNKTGQNALDMLTGTKAGRDALVAALGPRSKNVTNQVSAERAFLDFDRGLKGGSTTARQLAELGFVGGTAGAGYMTGFDPMQAGSIAGAAVLAKRGGSKLMEAIAKKNEAAVAPEVARRLIERSLPELVDAEGKAISETARRRLVEALMMVGGKGTALAYGQN